MQKLFGDILSKDWVFVRAACVPHLTIDEETTKPCVNCQQFILKDVNGTTTWLKQVIEHKLVTSDKHDQKVYENLVAELIYHISIKESSKVDKLISNPLTISRETERAFTGKTDGISGESSIPKNMLTDQQLELTEKAERISGESCIPKNLPTDEQLELIEKTEGLLGDGNLPKNMLTYEQLKLPEKIEELSLESNVPMYMLNNEQLQAVQSPAKFLIIDGDYGTGKTYVLKERAKKCAKDYSKDQLFYIDMTALSHIYYEKFDSAESSVMNNIAVVDFDFYPNITVITAKDLRISESPQQTDVINAFNSFLRDNHCDHLFIDEMIIGDIVFPDSIETNCVNLKVRDKGNLDFKTRKAKWLETMKVNHNAVHINLTKNMRNSQNILNLAKAIEGDSTQQVSCSPYTNVMGNHNFYYRNIYDIDPSLLAVAAVNKYFKHKPKESVVVLAKGFIDKVFELLHKHCSSTTSVIRNFEEYMKRPEGLLVTSIEEFQGAQARNIIICQKDEVDHPYHFRNSILRTMSHAIVILDKFIRELNNSGAIEDKNLHKYIYPEGKAPECHHYHNKYKHDISALTMAILDKYKLLDQDESIAIITHSRISKDIIREANTKEFLSLPTNERKEQIQKKIELENKELYEDVKRNISRNNADISWSYCHINYDTRKKLKNLVNKPRHINYINMNSVTDYENLSELKNIIVFADENIDLKFEFAAWRDKYSLKYSAGETSIDVVNSKWKRIDYDRFCRNGIMLHQPKVVIVVHDDNFESFNQPEGALNLIEDDNLHEHIPATNTELSNQ